MKLDIAELKKRFQTRSVLAVTLESGCVIVDYIRSEENVARMERSFKIPLGAEAVVSNPERAGEELAAQLETHEIRERRCVVCIPAGWALTTSTTVPEISAEDLRGYLELRAESEFPIAVADLRLAHCAYQLPDGSQRATLAAVATKRLAAVERMLELAGCRAVSVSLGLNQCLPRPERPAALHFLANGNHVDVIIAAGGGIAALRSLPGPVAPEGSSFDAGSFCRDVRITLGGLPETVRQQVREAHFSGAPDTAEKLCREIREPLQRMGIGSDSCETAAQEAKDDHAGAAVEAAEFHLRGKPVAFEFVTPEVHRLQAFLQRFDSRKRRLILLGAGVFIVLPLLVFGIRSTMESRLQAEWDGMRSSVTELETLQQKIRQFRPWFEPAPRSVQLLEGLISAFPEQGDVWAKSIQLSEGTKVTCTGFARNQSAFMSFLDRLRSRTDVAELAVQNVRGENPVQFSVTYKWEIRDGK